MDQADTITALRRELPPTKDAPPKLDIRERVLYRYLPLDGDSTDEAQTALRAVTEDIPDAA